MGFGVLRVCGLQSLGQGLGSGFRGLQGLGLIGCRGLGSKFKAYRV